MRINKNKFVKALQIIKNKYHMSLAKIGRQCKIPVSSIYKLTSPHSHAKPIINSNMAKKIAKGLGFNSAKTRSWLLSMSVKKSHNTHNKNKAKHLQKMIKHPHLLKYGIHDMMSRKGISKKTLQKRTNIETTYLNQVLSGNVKEIPDLNAMRISKALGVNMKTLIKRSEEIAKNNHSANRLQFKRSSNRKPQQQSKPQLHVNPYIFNIAKELSKSNNKVIGTAENVIRNLSDKNYQKIISDLTNLNRHDFGIVAPLIMRLYNSERHN